MSNTKFKYNIVSLLRDQVVLGGNGIRTYCDITFVFRQIKDKLILIPFCDVVKFAVKDNGVVNEYSVLTQEAQMGDLVFKLSFIEELRADGSSFIVSEDYKVLVERGNYNTAALDQTLELWRHLKKKFPDIYKQFKPFDTQDKEVIKKMSLYGHDTVEEVKVLTKAYRDAYEEIDNFLSDYLIPMSSYHVARDALYSANSKECSKKNMTIEQGHDTCIVTINNSEIMFIKGHCPIRGYFYDYYDVLDFYKLFVTVDLLTLFRDFCEAPTLEVVIVRPDGDGYEKFILNFDRPL